MVNYANFVAFTDRTYRVAPKKLAHFVLYDITSSNIDGFSNLFHCQNQKNNTVTKNNTTP